MYKLGSRLTCLLYVLIFVCFPLMSHADTALYMGWYEVEGDGAPYSDFSFSLEDDNVVSAQLLTPVGGVYSLIYDSIDWWGLEYKEPTMAELVARFPTGNYVLTIVRPGGGRGNPLHGRSKFGRTKFNARDHGPAGWLGRG